ncbi:hypothetical protein [Streptomyces chartreusis]|uniref:hypothetical protein n=1 Tax=Streptomyces chartreusis TaxID=1969 RepID=UPI0037A37FD7
MERLAVFATLLATFGELHPLCDHWAQGSKSAARKRLYGKDLVRADGSPATPDSGLPTMTTSTLGRRAVACQCLSGGLLEEQAVGALTDVVVSASTLGRCGARHVMRTAAA